MTVFSNWVLQTLAYTNMYMYKCLITNNTSVNHVVTNGNTIMDSCIITNNVAGQRGSAGFYSLSGLQNVTRCLFYQNYGGTIFGMDTQDYLNPNRQDFQHSSRLSPSPHIVHGQSY